jgi:hypothetical protein
VFLGDRTQRIPDVPERQRDHLVPQREVDGRQSVEAEDPDQRAQRQPVDEQRGEDIARCQYGDEPLDRSVDRRVLGDRERQGERHRAAQAAP